MTITLGSYNLLLHKAYSEIEQVTKDYDLDVICLQECRPSRLQKHAGNLLLAGFASVLKRPAHGLAIYYNPGRLELNQVSSHELPLPLYERRSRLYTYRLQLARFTQKGNGKSIVVANIHLSNLLTPNSVRREQAERALEILDDYRGETSAIIAGDFNYPVRGRRLKDIFLRHGFCEYGAYNDSPTHTNRLLKGKFDRVFASSDLTELTYTVLPFGASDHAAVVVQLKRK